tara:strand:+ start:1053 stop:1196 length:144 start_codon:yes stop_codon:yes gene_type:complete
MKFFLDTASVDEIQKWKLYGIVQEITTNPTLLSKEGMLFHMQKELEN